MSAEARISGLVRRRRKRLGTDYTIADDGTGARKTRFPQVFPNGMRWTMVDGDMPASGTPLIGSGATWQSIGTSTAVLHLFSGENAGTGETPVFEWENMAIPMDKGWRLSRMHGYVRSNNGQIEDYELYINAGEFNSPQIADGYYDNDNELTNTLIGRWQYSVDAPAGAGLTDAIYLDFDDIDYDFSEFGRITVFARAVGTLTTTRYISWGCLVEVEL